MKKEQLIESGNMKKIFSTENKNINIVEYLSNVSIFYGKIDGVFLGQGIINSNLNINFYSKLEKNGIDTIFIEKISDNELAVKSAVKIQAKTKLVNFENGKKLEKVKLEFLNDKLENKLLEKITLLTHETNKILSDFLVTIGLEIIEFSLEFGLFDGKVILISDFLFEELSFYDIHEKKVLLSQDFRRDLGNVGEEKQELLLKLIRRINRKDVFKRQ